MNRKISLILLVFALTASPVSSFAADPIRAAGTGAYTVRIALAKETPKLKGRLSAYVTPFGLVLNNAAGEELKIPFDQVKLAFHDKGLHRKFLKKVVKGTAESQFGGRESKAVYNAAIGSAATVGGFATAGGIVAGMLPLAAFPPALIAIGGVAAFAAVQVNVRDYFIHIVWEEEKALRSMALRIRKADRDSLLSDWNRVSPTRCIDIPRERKSWRKAKAEAMPVNLVEDARFGHASLKPGKYKIAIVVGQDGRGQVCFFTGGAKWLRDIAAIVPVRIEPREALPKNSILISQETKDSPVIEYLAVAGMNLYPI